MSKSFKIRVQVPKFRKPVQKKPNIVMKSKKDYKRKRKDGKLWSTVSEE